MRRITTTIVLLLCCSLVRGQAWNSLMNNYVTRVDTSITTKSAQGSISPATVGNRLAELANYVRYVYDSAGASMKYRDTSGQWLNAFLRSRYDSAFLAMVVSAAWEDNGNNLVLRLKDESQLKLRITGYADSSNTQDSIGALRAAVLANGAGIATNTSGISALNTTMGQKMNKGDTATDAVVTQAELNALLPTVGSLGNYFPKSDFILKTSNKNIFDKSSVQIHAILTGTTGNILVNGIATDYDIVSGYIPVMSSTLYTLSGYTSTFTKQISYYDASMNFISGTSTGTTPTRTFSTPTNCFFIRFQIAKNLFNNDINTIQLELGSIATFYESYKRPIGYSTLNGYGFIANRIQKWSGSTSYPIDIMVEDSLTNIIYHSKMNGTTLAPPDTLQWIQKIADQNEFLTFKNLIYTAEASMQITFDTSTKLAVFKKIGAIPQNWLYVNNGGVGFNGRPNMLKVGTTSSAGWTTDMSIYPRGSGQVTLFGVFASDGFWNGTMTGIDSFVYTSIIAVPLNIASSNVRYRNFIVLYWYDGARNALYSPYIDNKSRRYFMLSETGQWFINYRKQPLFNKYPQFGQLLKAWHMAKLSYDTGRTIRIQFHGDSHIARPEFCSNVINPSRSFPGAITNNFYNNIIKGLLPYGLPVPLALRNVAQPYRFDAMRNDTSVIPMFSETGGGWITDTNDAFHTSPLRWDNVDGSNGRPRRYITVRDSYSQNSTISFYADTSYKRWNFLDKACAWGSDTNVITISGGSGTGIQYRLNDTLSWSEANGGTFSQLTTANVISHKGNTIDFREIQFRALDTVHTNRIITISKSALASGKALLYWGLEAIPENRSYIKFNNGAQGGKSINDLTTSWWTDTHIDEGISLYIGDLTLTNEFSGIPTDTATYRKRLLAFIWGEGPLADSFSLRKASNNWTKFSAIFIAPHYSSGYYQTATGTPRPSSNSGTFNEELWNVARQLFISKGDVAFIDMNTAANYIAQSNPDWQSNPVNMLNFSTFDGTHANDYMAEFWTREIGPTIWCY